MESFDEMHKSLEMDGKGFKWIIVGMLCNVLLQVENVLIKTFGNPKNVSATVIVLFTLTAIAALVSWGIGIGYFVKTSKWYKKRIMRRTTKD